MNTRVLRNGGFFACLRLRAQAQNDGVVRGLRAHPQDDGVVKEAYAIARLRNLEP